MTDEREIRGLIGAHFDALRWAEGEVVDWNRFLKDFLPDTRLFPAARPAKSTTLAEFVARMNEARRDGLVEYEERTCGMEILVFGNVAVVLAASEMRENGEDVNRDVNGYLLVKSEGKWRIAAHGWDSETPDRRVPRNLL